MVQGERLGARGPEREPGLPGSSRASRLAPRAAFRVFAAALLLYLGYHPVGASAVPDAVVMFDLTRSIVEDHSIALSGNVLGFESNRGIDGRYYSQYGIGQSLYNIPFYVAGRAVQRRTGARLGKSDSILKAAVGTSSAVAAAATVAVIFLLAVAMLERQRAALVAAALAGAGSLLWPYAKFGFNAPLTAFILAAMTLLLWRGVVEDRPSLLAWAGWVAGFGWLTRHEFPVIVVPVAVWLAVTAGRHGAWRRLMAFLPGVAAGGLVWCAYNFARFGRPFFVGYEPHYTGAGFYGLLFSPGASIFLYWPAILLCITGLVVLARANRPAAWLLALPGLAVFLYVGWLLDWPGGRSYGPRYLVPALPLLSVGAGALVARTDAAGRRSIGIAVLLSVFLQLPGVLVDYSRVSQAWASNASDAQRADRLYRWDSSAIVLNTRAALTAVPRNVAYVTGLAPVPAIAPGANDADRGFAQQFAFSLDFWWLYLFYLGAAPAFVAVGLGLLMWTGAGTLAARAWKMASD